MNNDLHLISMNAFRAFHIFTVLSAVAMFNFFENAAKGLSYTEEDTLEGD